MPTADFSGKVALVTGASGGVGLRVAEALARGGATVVVNSRSEESARRTVERLATLSENVLAAVGDCENYDATVEVTRRAASVNGGIDLLVSAGAASRVLPRPFADMSSAELVDAFESRLLPRIFPVHAALPHMRERGGAVVMLCTDAARHATAGESIPGAVGASVILMTKVFAKEFARWRIRVNSVAMTLTSDTPSFDRIFGEDRTFSSKLFTKLAERFPSGRPPTAEEVASVVTFLVSEQSAQVTGQTVSVNGGLSFGGW